MTIFTNGKQQRVVFICFPRYLETVEYSDLLNPRYKRILKFLSIKCSGFQYTSIGEYRRKLRLRPCELSGQD